MTITVVAKGAKKSILLHGCHVDFDAEYDVTCQSWINIMTDIYMVPKA